MNQGNSRQTLDCLAFQGNSFQNSQLLPRSHTMIYLGLNIHISLATPVAGKQWMPSCWLLQTQAGILLNYILLWHVNMVTVTVILPFILFVFFLLVSVGFLCSHPFVVWNSHDQHEVRSSTKLRCVCVHCVLNLKPFLEEQHLSVCNKSSRVLWLLKGKFV